MATPSSWYRDNFLISTNPSLIQPPAINAAFGSEALYWAKSLDEPLLRKMLENSLCFGVYELPDSSSAIAGRSGPRQIGLARLITDEVSTAYLTDVYILDEYQGKGLGKWLISCVDEVMSSWPAFRRALLITSGTSKFYEDNLGMEELQAGDIGLKVMTKRGPGSTMHN